jgi:hypothetical protein
MGDRNPAWRRCHNGQRQQWGAGSGPLLSSMGKEAGHRVLYDLGVAAIIVLRIDDVKDAYRD